MWLFHAAPAPRWLQLNATKLPAADKASAVCAAPPHLENGLAVDAAEALCQDDPAKVEAVAEEDAALRPGPGLGPGAAAVLRSQAQADARVALRAFDFDGMRVSLLWHVNVTASPYVCDSLFVYEEHVPAGGKAKPRSRWQRDTPPQSQCAWPLHPCS